MNTGKLATFPPKLSHFWGEIPQSYRMVWTQIPQSYRNPRDRSISTLQKLSETAPFPQIPQSYRMSLP